MELTHELTKLLLQETWMGGIWIGEKNIVKMSEITYITFKYNMKWMEFTNGFSVKNITIFFIPPSRFPPSLPLGPLSRSQSTPLVWTNIIINMFDANPNMNAL